MRVFAGIHLLLLALSLQGAMAVERLSFPKPKDMTLAEVVTVETVKNPRAVLVLCPGANGNGEGMIGQKEWQEFARENRLGLVGIHFQSPGESLKQCQGYYQVQNGSGNVLMDAVKKIYGKELPLLLFGFSGGAHFTTRMIEWKPENVLGWCALGAGVLDSPEGKKDSPMGIMACGDEDGRLGGALMFFKQGRAAGRPWLFVALPGKAHSMSPKLNAFAREYFSILLDRTKPQGLWVDVDRKVVISSEEAAAVPSVSGWLPRESLLAHWKELHEL